MEWDVVRNHQTNESGSVDEWSHNFQVHSDIMHANFILNEIGYGLHFHDTLHIKTISYSYSTCEIENGNEKMWFVEIYDILV